MERSDSIKNVMGALGIFQSKAVKIRKDSINPHFKSKYASLAVILDEIQPILTECKLVFTQVPEESTHLITMLFHSESGEFIQAKYELKAAQITPQGIGSAITYARRYSLTSILGLNIDDDDDGNEASKQPENKSSNHKNATNLQQTTPPPQPQQPITPFNSKYTDINAIIAVVKSAGKVEELNELYHFNKELINKNQTIKDAITQKRDLITNQGKVIITDGQFQKVCNRIRIGEASVYENAIKVYILNQAQIEHLKHLEKERALFDEALKLKYNNPADIASMIEQCKLTEHITRLHANNAMIIDRDPELQTRINAKLKVLKTAA